MIFATVQTLGQERYLCDEYFAPDAFDYIVIDEFHHAAADSYQKLLQYFKPAFLLGLTATPFRMDNRDILHLCDDNVIYEIYLRDSINRGYLVPFQYYAFYDDTDYDQIENKSGTYDVEQLELILSHTKRADLILGKFKQYAGSRTIAFCVGIQHAEYMEIMALKWLLFTVVILHRRISCLGVRQLRPWKRGLSRSFLLLIYLMKG